jgi:hypothetical protein
MGPHKTGAQSDPQLNENQKSILRILDQDCGMDPRAPVEDLQLKVSEF